MEQETSASGQFSDWILNLGDHIYDEHLKEVFSKALDHVKEKIVGLSTSSSLDLLNYPELDQLISDKVDRMAVCQLFHWAAVKHSHQDGLRAKPMQKAFYFVEAAPLLCILEGFLSELNAFFLESESIDVKEEGSCVDEDYVGALELYCLLKQCLLDIKHNWRAVMTVAIALPTSVKYASFADTYKVYIQSTLEGLVKQVHSKLQAYCSEDVTAKPKFYHLSKRLALSEKEHDALSFIFMQNVGVRFGKIRTTMCYTMDHGYRIDELYSQFMSVSPATSLGGSRHSSMALAAAAFAQFTSKEMLEFFDSDRSHMKQELLEPEDEFSSIQTTNFIKIPTTILKACCGCTLSAEDLYKIDKTAMAEILAVNDGTDVDPKSLVATSKDADELISKVMKGNDDLGAEEEEELSLELEEILKTCDVVQTKFGREIDEKAENDDSTKPQPYQSDLEYLEDNFQLIETKVKAMKTEQSDDSFLLRADQRKPEAVIREMKAKARSFRAKIDQRMQATLKAGGWLPRLERLASLRGLDAFEKSTLLILTGSMVSKNLRNSGHGNDVIFGHHLNIGSLIGLLCEGLEEQIHSRTYFYKNSKLVSEGLVNVSDPPLHSRGNFLDSVVELDRRLLDYIVGLDTEINELVDGSDLFTPEITLDDVALPKEHRELLVNTFQSYGNFQKTCKELGLSTKGMPKGLCLLFYGPSGTGKTMTANAVANYLKKKILLVTVSVMMERDLTKELLKFLFREAKIHNAVLFFDECESLFESRDNRTNPSLGIMLTEIELYDGVIILATNRQQDLDEAMHRRIQLSMPFSLPDFALRMEIWKSHVPASITAADINWTSLAVNHELTGGLISNAVLSALSFALKENSGNEKPVLTEKLLSWGAKQQLKGLLEMIDFERRVIPKAGLQELILESSILQQVELILSSGKSHKFISVQWGFGSHSNLAFSGGISCLICGSPGVGKTALAHAIAFELGQPIKEANCTELLSHSVSFLRATRGVAAFFRDAQKANAVIVLDGAEILLSSIGSSLLSGVVGCEHLTLAHAIEHFSGVVILNCRREVGQLDLNRLPKLRYVLNLKLPHSDLRRLLWKKLIPKKAPVSDDVNYQLLAERYQFNAGEIANVINQAAEMCAANGSGNAVLAHDQLVEAAELEVKRKDQRTTFIPSIFQ